jgi:hypothetical protein
MRIALLECAKIPVDKGKLNLYQSQHGNRCASATAAATGRAAAADARIAGAIRPGQKRAVARQRVAAHHSQRSQHCGQAVRRVRTVEAGDTVALLRAPTLARRDAVNVHRVLQGRQAGAVGEGSKAKDRMREGKNAQNKRGDSCLTACDTKDLRDAVMLKRAANLNRTGGIACYGTDASGSMMTTISRRKPKLVLA